MRYQLEKRNIVLLMYFVGFLDLLGVSMIIPMLSKHARSLGASPTVSGIIGSLYGGLQLFSSPLVGRWSDVSGRKEVLMFCLLLSGVGYAMFGLATSVMLLVLARIPGGLFKHTQMISKSFLVDQTPVAEHARILGDYSALSVVGFIVGPTIGGYLGETPGGRRVLFLLVGLVYVLNAAIVWFFAPSVQELKKTKDSSSSDEKQINGKKKSQNLSPLAFIQDFKKIEWEHLWDIFLVRFLMGFSVMVYRTNFSLMLEYKYEASTVMTGYLLSYSGVIGMVSGFLVGRIADYYKNDSKLLLHTGIVQMLSIAALTYAPTILGVVVFLTPLGISNAIARVCVTNLTIERGGGQETGALLGLGASVLSIARMLSPALGGLAQEAHLSGPAILGIASAAGGVFVQAFVHQNDRILSKHQLHHKNGPSGENSEISKKID